MKIISASTQDLRLIEREFKGNEPGIVVLPEGNWDSYAGIPNEHIIATLEYRLTIVGTKNSNRGFDVAYFLRRGSVTPAGIYLRDDINVSDLRNFAMLYLELNKPHEISPAEDDVVWAVIKQCSEIYKNPLREEHKVDLICVPSTIDHTASVATKELLLGVNVRNISENTLLAQAVLEDIAGTDIFQLPSFGRLGNKLDEYKVYKHSK